MKKDIDNLLKVFYNVSKQENKNKNELKEIIKNKRNTNSVKAINKVLDNVGV